MSGRRVLYVHGMESRVTVRDLVHEFERYGPVNRCDISRPTSDRNGNVYAFVEYVHSKDADESYRKIHGRRFRGGTIKVEWAKRLPRSFKEEKEKDGRGRRRSPSRSRSKSKSKSRSRSPPRGRSRSPMRDRSPSPAPKNNSPVRDGGASPVAVRSPSPAVRSPSPIRSPE